MYLYYNLICIARDITLTQTEIVYSLPDGGARKDAVPISSATKCQVWPNPDPHRENAFIVTTGTDELILVGNTFDDTIGWIHAVNGVRDRFAFVEVTGSPLTSTDVASLNAHDFELLRAALMSDDAEKHPLATLLLRRFVTVDDKNDNIQQVLDAELLPRLIEFLKIPSCQFEATWAITNIASGSSDDSFAVARAGAIPPLLELLKLDTGNTATPEVQAQALWTLGNLAGDCSELRDAVLNEGIVPILVAQGDVCSVQSPVDLRRQLAWLVANLCRNDTERTVIEPLMPMLIKLINTDTDVEVVVDSCWGLAYMHASAEEEDIQKLIDSGVVPRILDLAKSANGVLVLPAIRVIGALCSGSNQQTQYVLDAGFINDIAPLLDNPAESVRKEICWIISNITAGTATQLRMIFDWGLCPKILNMIGTEESLATEREAVYAVCNASSNDDLEIVMCFVQEGAIPKLCSILESAEHASLHIAIIDAFCYFLSAAGKLGAMTMTNLKGGLLQQMEEFGIRQWLEELIAQPELDDSISELCSVLLSNWNESATEVGENED